MSSGNWKPTWFECKECKNTYPYDEAGKRLPASFDDPLQMDRYVCVHCIATLQDPRDLSIDRPSWEEICMGLAIKLSKRSTCKTPDRQVGCVITTADHSSILAWGYNGSASGSDDPCDYDPAVEKGSRCSCAHAEMNALTKLNTNGHKDLIMYITLQPCRLCATLIVNAKCFAEVVYLSEYRDNKPVFTLREAGIQVRKSSICES